MLSKTDLDNLDDLLEALINLLDEAEDEYEELEDLCYSLVNELDDQDFEIEELEFDLAIYKQMYDLMRKDIVQLEEHLKDADQDIEGLEEDAKYHAERFRDMAESLSPSTKTSW